VKEETNEVKLCQRGRERERERERTREKMPVFKSLFNKARVKKIILLY